MLAGGRLGSGCGVKRGIMNEHPILFSSEMVNSILSGQKTQTRRIVKGDLSISGNTARYSSPNRRSHTWTDLPCYLSTCPYGIPGDLLWVRETWRAVELDNGNDGILYKADNHFKSIENSQAAADLWCDAYADRKYGNKWRPSIFMPRWASRILLDVTDVQVERIQEISDGDAIKEGIQDVCHCGDYVEGHGYHSGHGAVSMPGWATENFSSLWDSINAERGHSWESNPWVWVVSFKVVKL